VRREEWGMENKNDTRKENIQKLLLRLELWFAPALIIVPLVVSLVFLWDWYVRGYTLGISLYDGELFLGLLLLFGNLVFDIPFLRSLKSLKNR
jgi:hypothetical protein